MEVEKEYSSRVILKTKTRGEDRYSGYCSHKKLRTTFQVAKMFKSRPYLEPEFKLDGGSIKFTVAIPKEFM